MLCEGNQILGKYLQYLSFKVIRFLDYHIYMICTQDYFSRFLHRILSLQCTTTLINVISKVYSYTCPSLLSRIHFSKKDHRTMRTFMHCIPPIYITRQRC